MLTEPTTDAWPTRASVPWRPWGVWIPIICYTTDTRVFSATINWLYSHHPIFYSSHIWPIARDWWETVGALFISFDVLVCVLMVRFIVKRHGLNLSSVGLGVNNRSALHYRTRWLALSFGAIVAAQLWHYPLLNVYASVVVAPFMEEILFRGVLFAALARRIPRDRAAVVSSVIFSLMHLNVGYGPPKLIMAFFVGMFLSTTYYYERTLWKSIYMHALINSFALFLVVGGT
jgi:membrane protease YdiL (CAAX protease family)